MQKTRRDTRRARRRAGFILATVLCGGVALSAGVIAPAAAATPATTTLPAFIQGGTPNNQTTTFFGYAKPGEAFRVHFDNSAGISNGAKLTVKDPTGTVKKSGVINAGDTSGVFDYSGTSTADGVWSVEITDTGAVGSGANLEWNIEVDSTSGAAIPGRVFSNSIGIYQPGTSSDLSLYALTETGGIYHETLRGYMGIDSVLQVTNKGNVAVSDADCNPSYQSVPMSVSPEADGLGVNFKQPLLGDDCKGLQVYRLFLDRPAADLPESITNWADGRTADTWLGPKYSAPTITNLAFTRTAETADAGKLTGKLGTQPGTVQIQVDADGDGSYNGPKDRTLSVIVPKVGPFTVNWDGTDATGAAVPLTTKVKFKATLERTNEAHFIRIDAEVSDGGIEVERLTGGTTGKDTLYWDDSKLVDVNRESTSTPISSGKSGLSSAGGVHGWAADPSDIGNANTGLGGSHGDYRVIDDWTYGFDSANAEIQIPAFVPGQLQLEKTADVPNVDHGGNAAFTITVANTGPQPAVFDLEDVPTLDHLTDVTIATEGGQPQSDLTFKGLHLLPGEKMLFKVTGTVADGTDAWNIPNRVTITTPAGFKPTDVKSACTDDTKYSCAMVIVPAILVTPPEPVVDPVEPATPPAPAVDPVPVFAG